MLPQALGNEEWNQQEKQDEILLGVAFLCVGLRVTAQAEKSCL